MARSSGVKLSFDFEPFIEKLEKAGSNIDQAAEKVAEKCAEIMHDELKSEAESSGVPSSVTKEIKTLTGQTNGGNVHEITVGWKMGDYDPRNPSAGYKAVFLNYGTPKRTNKAGANRGKITGRGFILRAKKNAGKKLKKAQEEILQEVMKELE